MELAPPAVQAFADALAPQIEGDVRTDAMTRALYATDGSMYQKTALAVVLPKTDADVQATIRAARAHALPILPRGGGSSLAGQTVAAAVVLDFSRYMNAIVSIDAERGRAVVQPGLVLDRLTAELRPLGWMVGPDPASASRATLGGMVGNNATGTHSIAFGNTIHHTRRLRGFLDDGTPFDFGPLGEAEWHAETERPDRVGEVYRGASELARRHRETIVRDTSKHWRRNSGYRLEHLLGPPFATEYGHADAGTRNLARILPGSEGTLAVVTEIEIDLVRRPAQTVLGVVHYDSLDASLRSTVTILSEGPTAVELFDGVAIRAARSSPGFADKMGWVKGDPEAVLIVEFSGDEEADLGAKLDALEARLAAAGEGYAVVRATSPGQIAQVWGVRKEGLGLIMSAKGDHKPIAFVEDASVPVEHLADYIDGLTAALRRFDTPAAIYAHASAGTLHVRPFINTKTHEGLERMEGIAVASMELVRGFGGTVSSEHGDGRARSWLNRDLLGDDLYAANVELKQIFDPDGLLNPGNIVESGSMKAHQRLGPDYQTIPVLTEFDWSAEGGFDRAVEMCNGNGACRKLESGVMCPSYMVTREEEHSTRGRANALRMAMSGAIGPDALTSERMYEVMDLCVACKGCKTECPSNVDMGRMKTEWLGTYYAKHGVPARTRFFASAPKIARLTTGLRARLVNRVNRTPAARKLMEATLGIDASRELPPFAPEPFSDWFARQTWRSDGPPVVLYADTFTNHNHPEIGQAAARFLDRAGYAVQITTPDACCGRPQLSKGLVREAKALALRSVERLMPHVEAGVPIVGLEPSCILTFRDEWRAMLPGDERVERLAGLSMLFEDFVASEVSGGRMDGLVWKPIEPDARVLLHGHCHQKALAGMEGTLAALALPGYAVELIDSSCCGMAGSFGYEKEHQEVSRAMAERRLMPAVRAAGAGTIVAAPGTSCRAQISDLSGARPLHPAQVLEAALA
jgi:FAD/FMN-containing dehydrogenase/Fe-S oxidoreductase